VCSPHLPRVDTEDIEGVGMGRWIQIQVQWVPSWKVYSIVPVGTPIDTVQIQRHPLTFGL
jgi:hypothetical protein